jgi:hypothetical protein
MKAWVVGLLGWMNLCAGVAMASPKLPLGEQHQQGSPVQQNQPVVRQGPAQGGEPKPWARIKLREVRGDEWSLASIARIHKPKAIVLVTINTQCPVQALYLDKIKDLATTFMSDSTKPDIQVVGLSGVASDTPARLRAWAADNDFPFPIMKGGAAALMGTLGMERSPEFVVLDSELNPPLYTGAFDDQFTPHGIKEKADHNYLIDALTQHLAGKPVEVKETEAKGCKVEAKGERLPKGLTYAKDIAPILNKNCVPCHREGGIQENRSFESYDEVSAWTNNIKLQVGYGFMPPVGNDPSPERSPHGGWADDKSLSPADRLKILGWIEEGAEPGDERLLKAPPAAPAPGSWEIAKRLKPGEKLHIVRMTKPEKVKKSGEMDYVYVQVPTGLAEDKWIGAIEVHPGARKVVHHIEAHVSAGGAGAQPGFLETARKGAMLAQMYPKEKLTPGFISTVIKLNKLYGPESSEVGNYVPGEEVRIFPPGMGVPVKAGSEMTWEMHYTPDGQQEYEDQSEVALLFVDKPSRRVITNPMAQFPLAIPAGAQNFKVENTYTFPEDGDIVSLHPHAHKIGKSWRYVLKFPDGKEQTILSLPHYDYRNQPIFRPETPIRVPKGTVLTATVTYDNSKWNPFNPHSEPEKIYWGPQTNDEMANAWLGWSPLKEIP